MTLSSPVTINSPLNLCGSISQSVGLCRVSNSAKQYYKQGIANIKFTLGKRESFTSTKILNT